MISDGDIFTNMNNFYIVLWPIRRTPFELDQSMRNKFYDTLRQILCFVLHYYQGCFSTHGNWREHLNAGIRGQKYDFFVHLKISFFIERTFENKVYTFSNWIFIIVYLYSIDTCYSVRRLLTQER